MDIQRYTLLILLFDIMSEKLKYIQLPEVSRVVLKVLSIAGRTLQMSIVEVEETYSRLLGSGVWHQPIKDPACQAESHRY